jgi:hypothetical protein
MSFINQVGIMITERDLKSHDDYESFAKYLGIEYEDYFELIGKDSDDELEKNLSNISNTYATHKKR